MPSCESFEGELMDTCMNAYQGMLCPKEEVEICTQRGRWDGMSICCHIRKAVGWAVLGIPRSSVQAMLEAKAVTLSLTEASSMCARRWSFQRTSGNWRCSLMVRTM